MMFSALCILYGFHLLSEASGEDDVFCNKPNAPSSGWYNPKQNKYRESESVSYTCGSPNILYGSTVLTCLGGEWSSYPPFCLYPVPFTLFSSSGEEIYRQHVLQDLRLETCLSFPSNSVLRVHMDIQEGWVFDIWFRGANDKPVKVVASNGLKNRTCIIRTENYYCSKSDRDDENIYIGPTEENITICDLTVHKVKGNLCFVYPRWNIKNGLLHVSTSNLLITCDEGYFPKDGRSQLNCPDTESWDTVLPLSCVRGFTENQTVGEETEKGNQNVSISVNQNTDKVPLIISLSFGSFLLLLCIVALIYCIIKRCSTRHPSQFSVEDNNPENQKFPPDITSRKSLAELSSNRNNSANSEFNYHTYSSVKYSDILERIPLPTRKKKVTA